MDFIAVTNEEIDVGKSLKFLSNPSCGGTACFIGTTRNEFMGKEVVELQYEAYVTMAMKEMQKISEIMKTKWHVKNVLLIHRIGTVPVCEVSVLVAASAIHRKEAIEAVAFGIDAIKSEVPIWKKEKYGDGTVSWKENFMNSTNVCD